jgi:hypothetical protein
MPYMPFVRSRVLSYFFTSFAELSRLNFLGDVNDLFVEEMRVLHPLTKLAFSSTNPVQFCTVVGLSQRKACMNGCRTENGVVMPMMLPTVGRRAPRPGAFAPRPTEMGVS